MPRVAQYEPNQVATQVASQPTAQNAPTGAFGGQVISAVGDLALAASRVKQRIDTTSAEEALVKFERDKNSLFFNPENGFFNTQGRNAFDASPVAGEQLEELKKTHGESLGPDARIMFDNSADIHITRGQVDIAKHASKGLKAWEIATIETQVENALESGALYWNNSDQVKVQRQIGRQAILDSAEMQGLGPETTAENLQTFDSVYATGIIEAAMQNSAEDGKAALDDNVKLLEGPDKVKMNTLLDRKLKIEKTESDAVQAVNEASRLVRDFESRSEIIDEVNKIEDPELRKKTMSESMSQLSRKQQAEKEQEQVNYEDTIGKVNDGLTAIEIQAENSEAWLGMSDRQRNNVLSGKHMITDQILLSNLRSLPTVEKAKLNATDFSADLKPADLQKLTGEIEQAKKGNPGSRVKALSSKANAAAEGAFGKKKFWQKRSGGMTEKGKKANEFLNDLQDALDQFATDNSRKATPAEEDQIISEFTREILIKRSTFGFDFLAADDQIDLSNAPANDVRLLNQVINNTPNIELNDLVSSYQFLIDNNQPVTPGNLAEVYKQGRQ
jgi:hypothetical protein